jgi:hypothetical protein
VPAQAVAFSGIPILQATPTEIRRFCLNRWLTCS